MLKFLHTADLHLDSPLKGLSNHENAPTEEIRGASRTALTRLVTLAIEEAVSFVIIAGDIYDGDWRDYSTGQFFNSEMRRLQEHAIPVYLLYGNHDAESKITKQLSLPPNVHVFDTKSAQTYLLEGHPVALHGQGFATQHVRERLAVGYPPALPDLFNIGVLHTQVEGYVGHAPYAPCTLAELNSKDYQYWALGHVHQQEVLQKSPAIVYAGIPQGRHVKETGEKGCYIVTINDELELAELAFHPLETLRWEHLTVDVSEQTDWEQIEVSLSQAIREKDFPNRIELAVLRITLTGQSAAHEELIRSGLALTLKLQEHLSNESSSHAIWIESVRDQTSPLVDIAELRQVDELTDFVLTNWEKQELDQEELSSELRARIGTNLDLKEDDEATAETSIQPSKEEVLKVILSTLKTATPSE